MLQHSSVPGIDSSRALSGLCYESGSRVREDAPLTQSDIFLKVGRPAVGLRSEAAGQLSRLGEILRCSIFNDFVARHPCCRKDERP